MREKPIEVLYRFESLEMEQVGISVITYAEFMYGIANSSNPKKHQQLIDSFVSHLDILTWERQAAEHYGQIRISLKSEPIGSMDMLIAAHALSQDRILVTNNIKHFSRVPELQIETWT
jgi:tRNA(fMet)-specific endonuclease VapC